MGDDKTKEAAKVGLSTFVTTIAIALSFYIGTLSMFRSAVYQYIDVQLASQTQASKVLESYINGRIDSLSKDVNIMQAVLMEERFNRELGEEECITAEMQLNSWPQQEDLLQDTNCLVPMPD